MGASLQMYICRANLEGYDCLRSNRRSLLSDQLQSGEQAASLATVRPLLHVFLVAMNCISSNNESELSLSPSSCSL